MSDICVGGLRQVLVYVQQTWKWHRGRELVILYYPKTGTWCGGKVGSAALTRYCEGRSGLVQAFKGDLLEFQAQAIRALIERAERQMHDGL